jgi:IS5 family transposase
MSTRRHRDHDAQNPRRVFISGQKRGVFAAVIKRELRRRSAIEPIIGHLKAEGHFGRCYLKGRAGDAANVIPSAVGYNFRRVLAWLKAPWRIISTVLMSPSASSKCSNQLLSGRLERDGAGTTALEVARRLARRLSSIKRSISTRRDVSNPLPIEGVAGRAIVASFSNFDRESRHKS